MCVNMIENSDILSACKSRSFEIEISRLFVDGIKRQHRLSLALYAVECIYVYSGLLCLHVRRQVLSLLAFFCFGVGFYWIKLRFVDGRFQKENEFRTLNYIF
ncbi:Hypothetical_protein [Hexamita inflata]|uniref:Hypothetical_protein n=1 Tax=Hexamita inflata TaxID=28002 RepID=A0AA86Q0H3_9EUKA|nr:Hypothetical protein HINF_LOCUS35936 [Hexamita inflata]